MRLETKSFRRLNETSVLPEIGVLGWLRSGEYVVLSCVDNDSMCSIGLLLCRRDLLVPAMNVSDFKLPARLVKNFCYALYINYGRENRQMDGIALLYKKCVEWEVYIDNIDMVIESLNNKRKSTYVVTGNGDLVFTADLFSTYDMTNAFNSLTGFRRKINEIDVEFGMTVYKGDMDRLRIAKKRTIEIEYNRELSEAASRLVTKINLTGGSKMADICGGAIICNTGTCNKIDIVGISTIVYGGTKYNSNIVPISRLNSVIESEYMHGIKLVSTGGDEKKKVVIKDAKIINSCVFEGLTVDIENVDRIKDCVFKDCKVRIKSVGVIDSVSINHSNVLINSCKSVLIAYIADSKTKIRNIPDACMINDIVNSAGKSLSNVLELDFNPDYTPNMKDINLKWHASKNMVLRVPSRYKEAFGRLNAVVGRIEAIEEKG